MTVSLAETIAQKANFDDVLDGNINLTEIEVNFEEPMISVDEDVPSGSIDVCFSPSAPSDEDYTVVLVNSPSGSNPATRKSHLWHSNSIMSC